MQTMTAELKDHHKCPACDSLETEYRAHDDTCICWECGEKWLVADRIMTELRDEILDCEHTIRVLHQYWPQDEITRKRVELLEHRIRRLQRLAELRTESKEVYSE